MKKIILGLTIAVSLVSCSKSPENQAKENIDKFITEKMDDPKSYESVSFGKLEKEKSSYRDDDKYKDLLLQYDDVDKKAQVANEQIETFTHENTIAMATQNYKNYLSLKDGVVMEIERFKKEFKPVDIYKIKHSYRGKNKMGALVLDSCTVVLDKELKVEFIQ